MTTTNYSEKCRKLYKTVGGFEELLRNGNKMSKVLRNSQKLYILNFKPQQMKEKTYFHFKHNKWKEKYFFHSIVSHTPFLAVSLMQTLSSQLIALSIGIHTQTECSPTERSKTHM